MKLSIKQIWGRKWTQRLEPSQYTQDKLSLITPLVAIRFLDLFYQASYPFPSLFHTFFPLSPLIKSHMLFFHVTLNFRINLSWGLKTKQNKDSFSKMFFQSSLLILPTQDMISTSEKLCSLPFCSKDEELWISISRKIDFL